jgi:AcrR family transcriptional regulator
MPEGRVKRDYHSPMRAAQVELSRVRVLTAARELFLAQGYAATSIAAIAARAGVVRETVYKLFGTKAGLLKRLYDVTVAGDPDETPIEGREWWEQMLAADPPTLIATFARANTEVGCRLGAMLTMITAGAAAGDADLRELSAIAEAERLTGVRSMVDALARKAGLRDGLNLDEAADVVWALSSPEMWQLLTQHRGWEPARYQAWLERSLRDSLLG